MEKPNYFRKVALIAGIGYLIIFISGIFANFFVIENIIVDNNAADTWNNLTNNIGQFKTGIFSFIIMVLFDLVLTWALYVLLKSIDKDLSLFAAWFRLVNCTLFAVALFSLFDVLELTSQAGYLATASTDFLQTGVMSSLARFNYTWLLGLVFFGIHLLALAIVVLRSGYIPKFIGYLLLIAGAGYLVDSFAQFFLSNYEAYTDIFAMAVIIPGVVGELSFTIWLLIKGGRVVQPIAN